MIFIKNDNNCKLIETPDDILVLVNKNNFLYKDFIPNNLEVINEKYSVGIQYLVKDAKEAFEKLCEDAKELGYIIKAESAYRDYHYQEKLYNDYRKEYGEIYTDKISAKAGHSEHQTGLAIDVQGKIEDYNKFALTDEFSFMKENAHKYGFILRYPKDKQEITGYKYEPWHYRYVGEIAKTLKNNNLTLEEYLKNN